LLTAYGCGTIAATALEFNNSKVIMFDPGPYNQLTWQSLKDQLGIDRIKQLLSGKQLVHFSTGARLKIHRRYGKE